MKTSQILNISRLLLVAGSLLATGQLQAQFALSKGCLYVYQIGDGYNNLVAEGASVFIDQFSNNGTLLNQVALPTNGANAFIASGASATEGSLSLSSDGKVLVFAGYNTNLNIALLPTTSMNSRPTVGNNRDVGSVSANGTFSIVAISTNFFQPASGAPRGAVTDGDGNYWVAGSGSGGGGITNGFGVDYYGTNAAAVQVTNMFGTPRSIQIYGTNLYYTANTSPTNTLDVLPESTNAATTPTTVITDTGDGNGTPTPEGFVFNTNMTICYIAEGAASSGGVRRYDLVGGIWTYSYVFSEFTAFAFVTADFSGANAVIYATTLPQNPGTAGGNQIDKFVDTGSGSAGQMPTVFAMAPSSSTSPGGAGINYNGILFDSIAVAAPTVPLNLTSPKVVGGGVFNFSLANTAGLTFKVYAATNVASALVNWTLLGTMTESPAGTYQYTDTHATNSAQQFYQVRWP